MTPLHEVDGVIPVVPRPSCLLSPWVERLTLRHYSTHFIVPHVQPTACQERGERRHLVLSLIDLALSQRPSQCRHTVGPTPICICSPSERQHPPGPHSLFHLLIGLEMIPPFDFSWESRRAIAGGYIQFLTGPRTNHERNRAPRMPETTAPICLPPDHDLYR